MEDVSAQWPGVVMSVGLMRSAIGVAMVLLGMQITPDGQAQVQSTSFVTPEQQELLDASDTADQGAQAPVKGDDNAAQAGARTNRTRSLPFCVLRAFDQGVGWMQVFNYTTTGVSLCNVKSMESLTAASAKAQMATLGSFDAVIVEGPYYHTMDVNKTQVNKPYIALGDLRFSEVGRSEFSVLDALQNPDKAFQLFDGDATYQSIRTTGEVNFIWFAGTKIYVLTSDVGEQFVMTGVTHSIAFGQNGIRLKNLAQYLNLPKGWTFKATQLTRVLSLNSSILGDVQIFRLGDEFGNIYLKLPAVEDLSQMVEPV